MQYKEAINQSRREHRSEEIVVLATKAVLSYPVQHNFSKPCYQIENKSVCSKHPPTLGSQELFTSWLL